MARHAYLITAYDDFYTLGRLVRLLDDPRNDIYIHVDRKSNSFAESAFLSDCGTERVVLAPRRKVHWGDYTQISSVLSLIRLATSSKEYDYFHLLSGSDLPLKTQDYIHEFCEEHRGQEFVSFHDLGRREDWVRYAYTFNRLVKARNAPLRFAGKVIRHGHLGAQKLMKVDRRTRIDGELRYGSDWFSITHGLARLLLVKEDEIERAFGRAAIPTEFYVQTVLWNSDLRGNVLDGGSRRSNMRLIDWERGSGSSPYVFRDADYAELLASEMLFARKFDSRVDRRIIDRIYDHVAGLS